MTSEVPLPSGRAAASFFRAAATSSLSSSADEATSERPVSEDALEVSPRTALDVVIAVARELAHLHDRGLVHGSVDREHIALSVPELLGKPLTAMARSPADHDVSGLGRVLVWLLAGADEQASADVVDSAIASRPHLDSELGEIATAAMRRELSAAALADALEDYLDEHDDGEIHRLIVYSSDSVSTHEIGVDGLVAGGGPEANVVLDAGSHGIAFEVVDTGFGLCVVPRDREIRTEAGKRHEPLPLAHGVAFRAAGARCFYRRDASPAPVQEPRLPRV